MDNTEDETRMPKLPQDLFDLSKLTDEQRGRDPHSHEKPSEVVVPNGNAPTRIVNNGFQRVTYKNPSRCLQKPEIFQQSRMIFMRHCGVVEELGVV